jgi:hypothetical protein
MENQDGESQKAKKSSITTLANRDAGEDPDDPYSSIDVSQLPKWWQQAISEHEEYDLRPYRPPRFSDGTLVPVLIKRLERELNVDINLIGLNAQCQGGWTVQVDKERITELGRRRSPDGYTIFDISGTEFEVHIKRNLKNQP